MAEGDVEFPTLNPPPKPLGYLPLCNIYHYACSLSLPLSSFKVLKNSLAILLMCNIMYIGHFHPFSPLLNPLSPKVPLLLSYNCFISVVDV